MSATDADVVIVGGGFFGCALALYLRSVTDRIVVVEEQDALLTRASRVNQARVHSGFHYPRSFVTALRSRELGARFAADFPEAVRDDFTMLYAIARRRSKVSAARFWSSFKDMAAPIRPADPRDAALFDPDTVEKVFAVTEPAFDWSVLRDRLAERMAAARIDVRFGETALAARFGDDGIATLELASGTAIRARHVFNVTYGGLNALATASGFAPLPLKYELAELALVTPPEELAGRGVTVMDGPFFSIMPYPSKGDLYSFTHVRYTPHLSWTDGAEPGQRAAYSQALGASFASRWRHMMMDSRRYMPSLDRIDYAESLYEVKTVLARNERDDGRPILMHRHRPGFTSVMGGKIDNIYDLFDVLGGAEPDFARADDRHLMGRG